MSTDADADLPPGVAAGGEATAPQVPAAAVAAPVPPMTAKATAKASVPAAAAAVAAPLSAECGGGFADVTSRAARATQWGCHSAVECPLLLVS